MAGRQLGFWLAVAGVAIIAPVVVNLAADGKPGDLVPGLRTLNHYTTRSQG